MMKSPSSVSRYTSTRIDEGRKCRILLAMEIRACTVVGTVEGSPLYDPGFELYYWEGESSASITINGMGKKKELKCITAAVIIRYPSNLHRSTRSGPTAVYNAIDPCTTFLITDQYDMMVIELAELLSELWFPLSTNPGRADQTKVGLHCAGGYRGRRLNDMSAYRGVGVYE